MGRGYVATWRNVDSDRLNDSYMRGSAIASEQISKGLSGVGNAFSEYGANQKKNATEDAIGRLTAAPPEEREAIIGEFAQDGNGVDNERLGNAWLKLQSESRTAEQAQAGQENSDRSYNLNMQREKRLSNTAALNDKVTKQNLADKQKQNEFMSQLVGGESLNVSKLSRAKAFLPAKKFALVAEKVKNDTINQIETNGSPDTVIGKEQAVSNYLDGMRANGVPASSISTTERMLYDHYGLSQSPSENRGKAVVNASDNVYQYVVENVDDNGNFTGTSKDLASKINSAARKAKVKPGSVAAKNLDVIREAVTRDYQNVTSDLTGRLTALLENVNDPNTSTEMKAKDLATFETEMKKAAGELNKVQDSYHLNEKDSSVAFETVNARNGYKEIARGLIDAKKSLNDQIDASSNSKVKSLNGGTKALMKLKDKYNITGTLGRMRKAAGDGWGKSQDKVVRKLVRRADDSGVPRELFLKALEQNVMFDSSMFGDSIVDGDGSEDDLVYEKVAELADKMKVSMQWSYPDDGESKADMRARIAKETNNKAKLAADADKVSPFDLSQPNSEADRINSLLGDDYNDKLPSARKRKPRKKETDPILNSFGIY